jgi:uncharacterized protein YnzC (UPF0291/DUF896 family)
MATIYKAMLKESSYYTFLRINEKIKPRKNNELTSSRTQNQQKLCRFAH